MFDVTNPRFNEQISPVPWGSTVARNVWRPLFNKQLSEGVGTTVYCDNNHHELPVTQDLSQFYKASFTKMCHVCKHEETMIVFSHCFTFGLLFKVVFIFKAIFLTCSVIHNNVFACQRSTGHKMIRVFSLLFFLQLSSILWQGYQGKGWQGHWVSSKVDQRIPLTLAASKKYFLCDKTYISV